MVYTIISRLPFITSDKSNKRFFKIFVFGSLLYVLLHYYIFQKDQEGILETVKMYLYYAMALDLCLAYALDQFFGTPIEENKKTNDELPNSQTQKSPTKQQTQQIPQQTQLMKEQTQVQNRQQANKYTPEQMAELEKRYIEWKRQQELAEKQEKNVTNSSLKENSTIEEESSLPKPKKGQVSSPKRQSEKSIPDDSEIPKFSRHQNSN